ncbi:MAG: phosphate-starvation-inducible PsiE family protein [Gammaproteobacteria bacterium]|nr:phosphate-starvation-inducible PsiE family protein [Gammaproteobacteria bacterium]
MNEKQIFKKVESLGDILIEAFHLIGLFIIGATVIWSGAHTYFGMLEQGYASLKDILLLFIYLELGAMIGIYFKTRRLPVRFLIYIAITALTRMLTIDIKAMANETILTLTGAILLLTLAVLVLRYGEYKCSDTQDKI